MRTYCSYSCATIDKNTVRKIAFIRMMGRMKMMAFQRLIAANC